MSCDYKSFESNEIYGIFENIFKNMQSPEHHHHHKHQPQGPLLPRQAAPKFNGVTAVLANGKFKKVSLDDYKGKYVVLLFYPFDFTYVCPTELHAFSDAVEHFRKLNTEVLGVSIDSHFTHLAWRKTPRNQGGIENLEFPLIADHTKVVSSAYGVLVQDETDDLFGATLRALYIIDGKGVIRHVQVNDAPGTKQSLNILVGRSVDETLRLVEAF